MHKHNSANSLIDLLNIFMSLLSVILVRGKSYIVWYFGAKRKSLNNMQILIMSNINVVVSYKLTDILLATSWVARNFLPLLDVIKHE